MSNKVLAGRYELFERVGEGGMSVVYKGKRQAFESFCSDQDLKAMNLSTTINLSTVSEENHRRRRACPILIS